MLLQHGDGRSADHAVVIGRRRARRRGFTILVLVAFFAVVAVCAAIGRVDVSMLVLGWFWVLDGSWLAWRGFANRVDVTDDGLIGCCGKGFRRAHVRWRDVIGFSCVGEATITKPILVAADVRDGPRVTLINFGSDFRAAEDARQSLTALRDLSGPEGTI